MTARLLIDIALEPHVLGARQAIGQLLWEDRAQQRGYRILGRQRHHIGRRTLQHGDLGRLFRERWHQGHGGRTTADDHHALAATVQILGPLLRMDDGAAEVSAAREFRGVAARVVVITAAHEQHIAGQTRTLTRAAFHLDGPARVGAGPPRRPHALAEADVLIETALGGRFLHIGQDRRPIGDRFRRQPGLGVIAHGVHVAVRAYARIAEQIPGTTDNITTFENRKGLAWTLVLQLSGGADAGQTGTNDDHVEMFHARGLANRAVTPARDRSSRPAYATARACCRTAPRLRTALRKSRARHSARRDLRRCNSRACTCSDSPT